MNDDDLRALHDTLQAGQARFNVVNNVGVNPNTEAEIQRKAREAGVSVDYARLDMDTIDRRLAQQYANRLDLTPALRTFLADRDRSRLIANEPQEYERLSYISKLGRGLETGWETFLQARALSNAISAQERIKDPFSVLDTQSDEAQGLGGTDYSFLREWANREDSPIRQEATLELDEAIADIVESQIELRNMPQPKSVEQISQAKSFSEAMALVAENPFDALLYTGVQSAAMMAPYLVGSVAGYAVNPLVGAAVMGSGSYGLEFGNTFKEALVNAGVNLEDPEAVKAALSNEDLVREASTKATARAEAVAAFDTVAGLVAPLTLRPVTTLRAAARTLSSTEGWANFSSRMLAEKNMIGGRGVFENLTAQALIGSGLGAAGEASGQLASGQELSIGDIVLEAMAEFTTAPLDVMAATRDLHRVTNVDMKKAAKATAAKNVLVTLELETAQSTLAKRDAGEYKRYIDNAMENTGLQQLYINSEDLRTSGAKNAIIEAFPEKAEEVRIAEATGGDVTITPGEYAVLSQQAPDAVNAIRDHVRSDADGFSQAEATAWAQSYMGEIRDKLDVLANATMAANAVSADAERAVAPLKDQLVATGMSEQEANSQIALQKALVSNLAGALGMSPTDFFEAYPVRVVNDAGQASEANVVGQPDGTLAQANPSAVRGLFIPADGVIKLMSSSDQSTFVHEMGHYWLNALMDVAPTLVEKFDKGTITERELELLTTLEGFLKWGKIAGADIAQKISTWQSMSFDDRRAFHEQFASGFEGYVKRGKAPTPELRDLFIMFKNWLIEVYRGLTPARIEISDDVASLYDRLFTSEIALSDLPEYADPRGVFDEAIMSTLSPEEIAAYREARKLATEDAESEIRARMERDAQLIKNKQVREERGLQAEYEALIKEEYEKLTNSPAHRAKSVFTKAGLTLDDGTVVRAKMDFDAAKRLLSPEAFVYARNHKFLTKEGGVPPAVISDMLHYDTPESMISDIATIPDNLKEVAKDRADARFLEKYGEFATVAGLRKLSAEAVHNDARLKVLATEHAALAKLVGKRPILIRAAKHFAETALGRTKLKNVDPRSFENAARRASRSAQKAFKKGNYAVAAQYKQDEILQSVLAGAARRVLADRDRWIKRMRADEKSSGVAPSYAVQINRVLATFGFPGAKMPHSGEVSLVEFQEKFLEDNGFPLDLPDWVLNPPVDRDYQNLTVSQFEELKDLVTAIATAGRRQKTFMMLYDKATVGEVVDELSASIAQNAEARGRSADKMYYTPVTKAERLKAALSSFFMMHLNASSLATIMDGAKYDGVAYNTLIRKADERGAWEADMLAKASESLDKILNPIYKDGLMSGDKVQVEGFPRPLTRMERFAFALNCGNDGNRQRLMDGYSINEQTLNNVLHTLSVDELIAVQKVWDYFSKLKPLVEKKERRVTGITPKWVEAVPITVIAKDGTAVSLRGGYYPIRYDPVSSDKERMRALDREADNLKRKAFTADTTRRSFVKARAQNVKTEPIMLTMDALFDGVNDIIHDLAWHEWLIDMNKLLRNGGLEAVKRYYGPNAADVLTDWVHAIALGDNAPTGRADKYLGAIRQGVSIAGLGFNVVSALVQATGLIPAATRVGKDIVPASTAYMASPSRIAREIANRSALMRTRERTRFRELNEIRGRVNRGSGVRTKIYDAAYAMMMFVQGHVDRITWYGAYLKFINEGYSQERASGLADRVVLDTQGSGMVKDRSSIENGGPAAKLFTVFYSFMGTAFRLNAVSFMGETDRVKATVQILMVSAVLPIVEGFLREALTLGGDDDEDDGDAIALVRKQFGNVVNFNLGTIVGAREMAGMVGNLISGDPVFTWRGPAGLRPFSDAVALGAQLQQGEVDKALIKAIINASGSIFGIPAAQINRTIDGADAYFIEKDTENPLALLLGYKDK